MVSFREEEFSLMASQAVLDRVEDAGESEVSQFSQKKNVREELAEKVRAVFARLKRDRSSNTTEIGLETKTPRESDSSSTENPLEAVASIMPNERWKLPRRNSGTWVPNLNIMIGQREIEGEQVACSVEDMVALDEEIAQSLLADEHIHTPITYTAPYPRNSEVKRGGDEIRANNDKWLITISEGHWPIPASYWSDDKQEWRDELGYDSHDTADWHMFFMMTAPREMQDQLTSAAKFGIVDRLRSLDNPDKRDLLLGDDDNSIELPNATRFSYKGVDAIKIIDEITDNPEMPKLMNTLLEMNSAEERDAYLDRYISLANMEYRESYDHLRESVPEGTPSPQEWVDQEMKKRNDIEHIMGQILIITNFNMRHKQRRNMTEEEKTRAISEYMKGIRRVSHKLAGDVQQ